MINVLAFIELKPGFRKEFIEIFQANVPAVRAEDGCISYVPCVDIDSGLPPQEPVNENMITVVECWESLEALNAHLAAPHMKDYAEKTAHMKVATKLKIVTPV